MSMISAQIDELRELAGDGSMEWLAGPVRASVLRDAADTIDRLRGGPGTEHASYVNGYVMPPYSEYERLYDENKKLRVERDTYRDLVDCMVHPDIPDQLAAENAKLLKELEAEHALAETLGRFHEDAKAENAELREFATETWELLTCNEPVFVWSGLQEKARELGVELE